MLPHIFTIGNCEWQEYIRNQVKLLKSLHKVGKVKKRKWLKSSKISDDLDKKLDKLIAGKNAFKNKYPFMKKRNIDALEEHVLKNQNNDVEKEL